MVERHATDQELRNRATFRLPILDGIPIDDHIRVCPACNTRYREIASNQPSPPPAPEPVRGEVDADVETGMAAGVTGTPTFYVNGIFLSGAQSFSAFEKIIEADLVTLEPKH
jgi:hypothetical protein